LRAYVRALILPLMNNAAAAEKHTYEIVIGQTAVTRVDTFEGVKSAIVKEHPGATFALRGYTTHQIRKDGLVIGLFDRRI